VIKTALAAEVPRTCHAVISSAAAAAASVSWTSRIVTQRAARRVNYTADELHGPVDVAVSASIVRGGGGGGGTDPD